MNIAIFLIIFYVIGAIMGAILGWLCHEGVLYGFIMGFIFSIIGWVIIVLPDRHLENNQSFKRTKIARIIAGSTITFFSILGLICILMSTIPAWENARHIGFSIIILLAFSSLGLIILWKGLRKKQDTD